MTPRRIETINQYNELVSCFRRKWCWTNDYLQGRAESLIADGKLSVICQDEENAFLLEQKEVCSRLYYYINDTKILGSVIFPETDIVTEILYRGDKFFPTEERMLLCKIGFKDNLIRDQYAAVYKDLMPASINENVKIQFADILSEVEWARNLFNTTFDVYSGDFIKAEEIDNLLANKQILIAKDTKGILLGALHQTLERNVAWISHVAIIPEARGKHIGKALLDAFIECNHKDDKSRYMLWVQKQNDAAVKMYQSKGFKYLNKSTLSMIKLKNR